MHRYISFIHAHFPSEEVNQYRKGEWQAILQELDIDAGNVSAAEASNLLRQHVPDYRDHLRNYFRPA
jgi:hypothetical protein